MEALKNYILRNIKDALPVIIAFSVIIGGAFLLAHLTISNFLNPHKIQKSGDF